MYTCIHIYLYVFFVCTCWYLSMPDSIRDYAKVPGALIKDEWLMSSLGMAHQLHINNGMLFTIYISEGITA